MRVFDSHKSVRRTNGSLQPSLRALDWFVFFVAGLQTGFGPFLSVYLTTQKWSQVDIGLVLSVGSIASLLTQVPGGWLVDVVRSKIRAAALSIIAIGVSAVLIALMPMFAIILAAKLLHVGATSVLGPAIAAITLGLVGHEALSERLGRNARFAAIGNGIAAAVMGVSGQLVSAQAVFYVTAALAIPTLDALRHIRPIDLDPVRAEGGIAEDDGAHAMRIPQLLRKPGLLALATAILFFQTANAAMLPLVGSTMTMRSSQWATALIAAAILIPQLVVAMISPWISQLAQSWGRRPVLSLGFGALALRGALLAATDDPIMITLVQILDGVSAAVLGILVPLVLADITRGTGRFNFAQGIVGSTTAIGAALSTIAAGYMADNFGSAAAFIGLDVMAIFGLFFLLLTMPETRPQSEDL